MPPFSSLHWHPASERLHLSLSMPLLTPVFRYISTIKSSVGLTAGPVAAFIWFKTMSTSWLLLLSRFSMCDIDELNTKPNNATILGYLW